MLGKNKEEVRVSVTWDGIHLGAVAPTSMATTASQITAAQA